MSELARELEGSGGVDAPVELSARLRGLLAAELVRGRSELRKARSGYGEPICVAFAPGEDGVLALCPAPPELRADAGAVNERTGVVVAAAVEALVEASGAGPPARAEDLRLHCGAIGDHLALRYPAAGPRDAAELATLALTELLEGMDRLRCIALLLPAHVAEAAGDWREPIGPTHPLRVTEAVKRLGGSALDEASLDDHGDAPGRAARAGRLGGPRPRRPGSGAAGRAAHAPAP